MQIKTPTPINEIGAGHGIPIEQQSEPIPNPTTKPKIDFFIERERITFCRMDQSNSLKS
jgi:hypothetical protein